MCWHKWSNWKEVKRDMYQIATGKIYIQTFQERRCRKCNKLEVEELP